MFIEQSSKKDLNWPFMDHMLIFGPIIVERERAEVFCLARLLSLAKPCGLGTRGALRMMGDSDLWVVQNYTGWGGSVP